MSPSVPATERESQRSSVAGAVPLSRRRAGPPVAEQDGQIEGADFTIEAEILRTAARARSPDTQQQGQVKRAYVAIAVEIWGADLASVDGPVTAWNARAADRRTPLHQLHTGGGPIIVAAVRVLLANALLNYRFAAPRTVSAVAAVMRWAAVQAGVVDNVASNNKHRNYLAQNC